MSFKVPVVQRPEYTIFFQDIDGMTWVHCDVRAWTASVCRRFKRDANALYEMHGGPVYALNEPAGCAKHRRFLAAFGFEPFKTVATEFGDQFVYKR